MNWIKYAQKRKVAGGLSGNFRGVCSVKNRTPRNDDTVGAVRQVILKITFLYDEKRTGLLLSVGSSCVVSSGIFPMRFRFFVSGGNETLG